MPLCSMRPSSLRGKCHRHAAGHVRRYCTSLMSWRVLVKSGWDREAAQTAIADLGGGGGGGLTSDVRSLRPRFLTDRLASADGKRLLFRCTIFLPRFCPVREVSGKSAPDARAARELAAMEAIRVLHGRGELDGYLRPSLETRVAEFEAAVEAEDWLVTRVAGDRIDEGNWSSLQTWRKPPQMRLSQNVPLALDMRMAPPQSVSASGSANGTLRERFWLYSFQTVASHTASGAQHPSLPGCIELAWSATPIAIGCCLYNAGWGVRWYTQQLWALAREAGGEAVIWV